MDKGTDTSRCQKDSYSSVTLIRLFHPRLHDVSPNYVKYVGMSCVCKDNHLLRCCIDIYCGSTLYTGELDELKLSDDNTILPLVITTHTIHHHYIAPTLTHLLTEYLRV
jgi:hypothetical protein